MKRLYKLNDIYKRIIIHGKDMAKNKHNKIKNVGVLFELLTRQITSDTINGKENSPAINIVKKFFKTTTNLSKELNIYKALQEQKYKKESKADKFIDVVVNEHVKLNKTNLKREKYNLIKEIKANYNLEDFFKSRVSNYRLNASIYTILESKKHSNTLNPKTLMECRYFLIGHITEGQKHNNKSNEILIKEYSKQDKDLRLLSYKILLEKFNDKYGKLSSNQRNLLKEYINNISNTSTLKKYISEEVSKINSNLNILTKKVKDNVVKIKLQEVQQQLNIIPKSRKLKDTHLVSLLRSYNLLKELKNVVK